MSLFHGDKPTVCKIHGFCADGGSNMALCSDLIVIDESARRLIAPEALMPSW